MGQILETVNKAALLYYRKAKCLRQYVLLTYKIAYYHYLI